MIFHIKLYFIRLFKFLILSALFFLILSLIYAWVLNTVVDVEWFKTLYPERFFDALILALLLPFFRTYKEIRLKVDEPEKELGIFREVIADIGYESFKDLHNEKMSQFRQKAALVRILTLNENKIFIRKGKNHIDLIGPPKKISKMLKLRSEFPEDYTVTKLSDVEPEV